MSYQVPQHIDSNKIFIVNRSEIEGRLDAQYYNSSVNILNSIKLSSFAMVKGGKRIPKGYSYSNDHTPYYYLRVADMDSESEIKCSDLLCIEKDIFDILERYEIREGELAISIAGTIGKVCILHNIPLGHRVILTENCAKIVVKNESNILTEYLKVLLSTSFIQKQLQLNYIQTTIPKLGLDRILNLKFPAIPSISYQRQVVQMIQSACTDKQERESKAQQLLESIDSYLLNELGVLLPNYNTNLKDRVFTISRKSLDNRWDPYYSQNYFKDAFAVLESCKYPIVNLKSIAKLITSGITPRAGGDAYTEDKEIGIPFVRSGNISIEGELDFDDLLYLKPEIHDKLMHSSQLQKNDILIAIVGATIGQVGIFPYDGEANINQAIALVRLKDGNNVQFIKELIKSSIGQLSLNRLKRPVARANINLEEISTIKVVLPPLDKQQEIANHISELRKQAKSLQEEGKRILKLAKQEVERMILQ